MSKQPDIMREFETAFGETADLAVSAPGRVNLIGEHTDYNRGWVLPMAIDRRVWAAGKPSSSTIELSSAGMPPQSVSSETITRTSTWADYPLGVLWALREGGCKIPAMKIHFNGNVPLGGGLSSSAAIEIATAILAVELCGLSINRQGIARLCQLAENQFVGVRCGAMDQMASALAEDGAALHIDCHDLSYDIVPFQVGDYKVAIIDSGVKRELAQSAYNKRRKECEQAAADLGVRSLREVDTDDLDKINNLPEPLNKRARHVITENARVLKAVENLSESNLDKFGNLMSMSHASLRDDYEVSIPELDFLVDGCNQIDGVLGARLTGAGFGGCIIALAHSDSLPEIEKQVLEPYRKKFNKKPTLTTSNPAEGARIEKA